MSAMRRGSPVGVAPHEPTLRELTPLTHYGEVKDACTKSDVNFGTRLAAMYTFGQDLQQDVELQNLTGIFQPAARCGVKSETSRHFPETDVESAHGYNLYFTFNRLLQAPCIRLECRFVDRDRPRLAPYHTLVLEFHFSLCDGKMLKRFRTSVQHERNGPAAHQYLKTVCFEANGATSEGFTNLEHHNSRFGESEQRVIQFLRSITSSEGVTLSFDIAETEAAEARELFAIRQRLPGGTAPLFDSIDKPQYFAFGEENHRVGLSSKERKRPLQLMRSEAPFPMLPLGAADTFTSRKQAGVHLGYGAYACEMEEEMAVQLWADVHHDAVIYRLDHIEVPILAVNFSSSYARLGNGKHEAFFKLPREFSADGLFQRDAEETCEVKEFRTLRLVNEEIPGLPPHDATFLVMNQGGFDWVRSSKKTVHQPGAPSTEYQKIMFKPKRRNATFRAHMDTCTILQSRHAFVPQLLNQDTGALENLDITRGSDAENVRLADAWLHGWKTWNVEQQAVLRAIHQAKGGMVITKGIAGTGKTLLQSAICLYAAQLGYKVLVAPPSNSNASHSAMEMNTCDREGVRMYRDVPAADFFSPDMASPTVSPVRSIPTVRRLFASALGSTVREISDEQGAGNGTEGAGASTARQIQVLRSLESTLLSTLKDRKAGSRQYSVEKAVIDEADKGEYKLFAESNPRGRKGRLTKDMNAWDVFRKHVAKARGREFNWGLQNDVEEFEEAYDLCKGQIVAATDILVTTTGNVRSPEVLEDWLGSFRKYGIPYKGVIFCGDEAFKDSELGTWNAIMAAGEQTKGVFLFGDEQQLAPTNTSSTGKLVFGQFAAQLSVALPSRLVREGYPFVFLKEQQRMHPCLSSFPNLEFYNGELRDGTRVRDTLEGTGPTSQPGLSKVLHGIIRKSFTDDAGKDEYMRTKTDEQARHAYIEINGVRKIGEDGTSPWVAEHIAVFFEQIFPDLQAFWQSETSKQLILITAYHKQRKEYRNAIDRLQRTQQLPSTWYPSVEVAVSPSSSGSVSSDSGRGSPTPPSTPSCEAECPDPGDVSPLPQPTGTKKLNPESAYMKCHTIDSAQGQEAFMVIVDFSGQHADQIGFMHDRGRCNVAMTRAKGVFWILGGPLGLKNPRNRNSKKGSSPFVKLKREMERQGRVHKLRPSSGAAAGAGATARQ